MPFVDIKITIKTKKIINLFKLVGIWRIQIVSRPFYLLGIWLLTHIRVYSISKKKLFPYFRLKRVAI